MPLSTTEVKRKARELGFNLCGLTPAAPSPTLAAYLRWIQQGMQGDMRYMARADRVRRRQDPREILPKAKSLILVGMDYYARYAEDEVLEDPARGRIAAYAWGLDYHRVLELRLPSPERDALLAEFPQGDGFSVEQVEDLTYVFGGGPASAMAAERVGDPHRAHLRPGNMEDVFLLLTGRGLLD